MHHPVFSIVTAIVRERLRRNADVPDLARVYQLLVTFEEVVDVGAWFSGFCATCGLSLTAPTPQKGGKTNAKRKRRKLKTVERGAAGAGAGASTSKAAANDTENGGADDGEVCSQSRSLLYIVWCLPKQLTAGLQACC